MIDKQTKKRIEVIGPTGTGGAGPYLMIPLEQLDDLKSLLNRHAVPYQVDRTAISSGGQPAVAVVDFEFLADVDHIQGILDSVN